VTIDVSSGEVSQDGGTPHWVRMVDVPKKGNISVYNPYTNDIEEYSWHDFMLAWTNSPGNESHYTYINAKRP